MIPTTYAPTVHTPKDFKLAQGNSPGNGPAGIAGYISRTGKLVLPKKSVEQLTLNVNLLSVRMKVGVDVEEGQKIDMLYLVPAGSSIADSFTVIQAAKGYTIELGKLLLEEGIMYKTVKYTFTIEPFLLEDGMSGYQLRLHEPIPKLFYIWSAFKDLQRQ
ncbi:hypothetical protein GCM10028818_56760 [Spirosoma horti]